MITPLKPRLVLIPAAILPVLVFGASGFHFVAGYSKRAPA